MAAKARDQLVTEVSSALDRLVDALRGWTPRHWSGPSARDGTRADLVHDLAAALAAAAHELTGEGPGEPPPRPPYDGALAAVLAVTGLELVVHARSRADPTTLRQLLRAVRTAAEDVGVEL